MGQMGHSQSAVSLDQWSQRTQSSGTAVAHLEESPSTQSFVNKVSHHCTNLLSSLRYMLYCDISWQDSEEPSKIYTLTFHLLSSY